MREAFLAAVGYPFSQFPTGGGCQKRGSRLGLKEEFAQWSGQDGEATIRPTLG